MFQQTAYQPDRMISRLAVRTPSDRHRHPCDTNVGPERPFGDQVLEVFQFAGVGVVLGRCITSVTAASLAAQAFDQLPRR